MKIVNKNSERLILRRGNIIFGSLFSFGCLLVLLPFTLFLSLPFISLNEIFKTEKLNCIRESKDSINQIKCQINKQRTIILTGAEVVSSEIKDENGTRTYYQVKLSLNGDLINFGYQKGSKNQVYKIVERINIFIENSKQSKLNITQNKHGFSDGILLLLFSIFPGMIGFFGIYGITKLLSGRFVEKWDFDRRNNILTITKVSLINVSRKEYPLLDLAFQEIIQSFFYYLYLYNLHLVPKSSQSERIVLNFHEISLHKMKIISDIINNFINLRLQKLSMTGFIVHDSNQQTLESSKLELDFNFIEQQIIIKQNTTEKYVFSDIKLMIEDETGTDSDGDKYTNYKIIMMIPEIKIKIYSSSDKKERDKNYLVFQELLNIKT